MYSYIYKAIQYLLTDLDIKYYNLFNNQFNDTNADAIPYPAILIDIRFSEAERYPSKIQMFDVSIDLSLATEFYNNLRKGDKQQDKGLKHLDLLTNLFKVLENKSTNDLPDELLNPVFNMGHIHRTEIEMQSDYNAIKVTKNTFMFRFTDASATPIYDEIYADMEIKVGYSEEQQKVI